MPRLPRAILLLAWLALGCGGGDPVDPSLAEQAGLDPDHACPLPDFESPRPFSRIEVIYDEQDGVPLLADLLLPEGAGPHPGLVTVHGGGWLRGDRGYVGAAADFYAASGFVVLNIEYRVIPTTRFPGMARDISCATSWLRAASEVDDQCVGILGESAGAHIGTLAALGANNPLFHGECEQAEGMAPSSRFVMPYYGVHDLVRFGELEGLSTVLEAWAGEGVSLEEVSPISYAAERAAVPVFLAHGTDDEMIPAEQSRRLHAALEEAGHHAELQLIEGAPHGFISDFAGENNQAAQPAAQRFLIEALGPIGR